jgi:signal transduction histidine kinase/DNA-binding response OmpR family regulator
MPSGRDQQILDLLAHAEGGGGGELPHVDSRDPVVQRLRAALSVSVQRKRELVRIEGYLERLSEAIMRYAMGDLDYTFELDPECDQAIDAVATGLKMMAEEVRGRTLELAHARDAATAANQAKSAFLANMSHELRTPLNAIIGYAELVVEEGADMGHDGLVQDVQRILRSGRLLLTLISDVLDMAKIEAGRMTVMAETFAVDVMCQDLVDTLIPLAAERKNQLVLNCPPDILMHSDLGKVRQILTNLLSNALKFTSEGRVTLSVRPSPDRMTLEVADTGAGIPAERLGAIFEPFVQADGSTQRRYGGTGLGLTLCRRFCRLLGGDIEVTSQVGVGSRFVARLSRRIEEASSYRETPYAPPPGLKIAGLHSEAVLGRVLVVDDDPAVHDLLRKHLRYQPVLVDCGRSGQEGLELALGHAPDLVVLDLQLPDLASWTTLARFKAHPALARAPVVMMSLLEDRAQGRLLEVEDYLLKPVDRSRLLGEVSRLGISERVLVVGPDADSRRTIQRVLETKGLPVAEARHGAEALELLERVEVELVVTDLLMPEMDGFELVQKMSAHPRHRAVPRLVLLDGALSTERALSLQSASQRLSPWPRERVMDRVVSVLNQVFAEGVRS